MDNILCKWYKVWERIGDGRKYCKNLIKDFDNIFKLTIKYVFNDLIKILPITYSIHVFKGNTLVRL